MEKPVCSVYFNFARISKYVITLSADDGIIREFVSEDFSLNGRKTLFLILGYHTKVELLGFKKDTHTVRLEIPRAQMQKKKYARAFF